MTVRIYKNSGLMVIRFLIQLKKIIIIILSNTSIALILSFFVSIIHNFQKKFWESLLSAFFIFTITSNSVSENKYSLNY